jgi:putative phosphoesterase
MGQEGATSMRVAVLSDTHWKGEDAVPDSVLRLLEDVDVVVHAGDLRCEKVLANLQDGNRRVLAVRGDSFDLDLAWLPDTLVEDLDGFKVGIAHNIGAVDDFAHYRKKPQDVFGEKVDCVIFGGTHHPFYDEFHGTTFLNPGSATDHDHSGSRGTVALLDINGQLNRVSFEHL